MVPAPRPYARLGLVVALVAAICTVDSLVRGGSALGALYSVPIFLSGGLPWRAAPLVVTLVSVAATVLDLFYGPGPVHWVFASQNRAVIVFALGVVWLLTVRYRDLALAEHAQREEALRMSEKLAQLAEQQAALLRNGVAIGEMHDSDELLESIPERAREVLHCRYAALLILGPDGSLERFVPSGVPPGSLEAIGRLPEGRGLLGLPLGEGRQALRLKDVTRYPGRAGFPPGHPEIHSFLAVPVRSRGQTLGRLYFAERIGADEFSPEDETAALTFANQAGAAVESARLLAAAASAAKTAEEALAQARAAEAHRQEMVAMVVHDLKAPLVGILATIDARLRRPGRVPREESERLGRIRTVVQDALHLIGNILDMSRLEAGKWPLSIEGCELDGIVRGVVADYTPMAEGSGKTIRAKLDGGPLVVRADRELVRRVLGNLLSNALRFGPRNVPVEIAGCRLDGRPEVVVSVTDRGPGIPPEKRAAIFEKFESLPGGEMRKGTGLGLAFCKKALERLGGRIWLEEPEGGGTRFSITLPAA